jgi:hypothetical protein
MSKGASAWSAHRETVRELENWRPKIGGTHRQLNRFVNGCCYIKWLNRKNKESA